MRGVVRQCSNTHRKKCFDLWTRDVMAYGAFDVVHEQDDVLHRLLATPICLAAMSQTQQRVGWYDLYHIIV